MNPNTAEGNLVFYVRGSGSNSYRVTFYDSGENLKAACTCPYFRRGGNFCKHAARLLANQTSWILEDSADIAELQKRAENSPLLEIAANFLDKSSSPGDKFKNLEEIETYVNEKLNHKDYWCERTLEDNQSEFVRIFKQKYTKTGKPAKNPALLLAISHQPYTFEHLYDAYTGEIAQGELVERKMPYQVNNTNYKTLSKAATKFLEKFELILKTLEE